MTARTPVAIVTGGCNGIGRVVADRLAAEGYHVLAADLRQSEPRLPNLIAGQPGVAFVELDVTRSDQVGAVFDDVVAEHGQIDILINNAGIQRHRAIEDLTWQEWSAVVDVNLHGVFASLQAAGRHMLAAGGGAIVNISSVASRGSAGRAPYATTKAAVQGLTATAAAEWATRGVRVNAVAPGYVDTGVFRQGVASGALDIDTILARIPARRLASPQEIADAVLFLTSDRACYITGQTLYVDGGFTVDYGVPLKERRAP